MAIDISLRTLRDNYLGEQDYRAFSQGSNSIAQRWIDRGRDFVSSLFNKADRVDDYDETVDAIADGILLYACSCAHYQGREYDEAKKCRNKAQTAIYTILGDAAIVFEDSGIKESRSKTSVKNISGTSKWNGYGGWDGLS